MAFKMIWMKIEPTNNSITTAKTIFNRDDHQAATFSPIYLLKPLEHGSETAFIYVKVVSRIHEIVRNL